MQAKDPKAFRSCFGCQTMQACAIATRCLKDCESRQKILYMKLRELIGVQSEGEWDDAMIASDARKFTAAIMPMFAALEAEIEVLESQRHAFRRDAMRWRMHQRMMLSRHSPASIREAREAVDAAIAAEEGK